MTARAAVAAKLVPAKAHEPSPRAQSDHRSIPPVVRDVLSGVGRPLDARTLAFLEPRIGGDLSAVPVGVSRAPLALASPSDSHEHAADRTVRRAFDPVQRTPPRAVDLGGVRIHTGPLAAQAARAVHARAFTVAEQIVFGADEYRPDTEPGRRLIAHEVAHVLQQRAPGVLHRQMLLEPPAKKKPGGGPPGETAQAATADVISAPQQDVSEPGTGKAIEAKAGAPPLPKAGDAPQHDDATKEGGEPKSAADLSTADLALIDAELAEHLRWAGAVDVVGTAGSAKRAAFVAQAVASGGAKFAENLESGAKSAAKMKLYEKGVEKVIVKLSARAASFTPLAAIGVIVGGYKAADDLGKLDVAEFKAKVAGYGQGAGVYDRLANSIEAISAVVEVATNIISLIGTAVVAFMLGTWVATVATGGAAAPIAVSITAVSLYIGAATMTLETLNRAVLKPLIVLFRSLHAFASEADPRDVIEQGNAIEAASGEFAGFAAAMIGGYATGKFGEKGVPKLIKIAKGLGRENVPRQKSGAGPVVSAEPQPNSGSMQPGAPGSSLSAPNSGSGSTTPSGDGQLSFDFTESSPHTNSGSAVSTEHPLGNAASGGRVREFYPWGKPVRWMPGAAPEHEMVDPPEKVKESTDQAGVSTEKAVVPIHETVNPNYPSPPGTPADVARLQEQIAEVLEARAYAARVVAYMDRQELHHKANLKPLARVSKAELAAAAAAAAHQQAVANREAANKQKQDREHDARAKFDDYPTRMEKLSMLKGAMYGLIGLTGLAELLPNVPDIVLRFKLRVLKINADTSRFLGKLAESDATVAALTKLQPAREAMLRRDAGLLDKTRAKAKGTGTKLESAGKTFAETETQNKDRIQQAASGHKEAQQIVAAMDTQAQQKQAQAESLAAAMQVWAKQHHQARLNAIEQTRKRLESMGYRVTGVSEL